jgi:hypothetical protein
MGLDTKTYWLSGRQSQCNFDFDFTYFEIFYSLTNVNIVARRPVAGQRMRYKQIYNSRY